MKKQDEDKDKRDKEEKETSREKRERSRSPRRYNTMDAYLMFYKYLGIKILCVEVTQLNRRPTALFRELVPSYSFHGELWPASGLKYFICFLEIHHLSVIILSKILVNCSTLNS